LEAAARQYDRAEPAVGGKERGELVGAGGDALMETRGELWNADPFGAQLTERDQ
jgi:hypothetical protein